MCAIRTKNVRIINTSQHKRLSVYCDALESTSETQMHEYQYICTKCYKSMTKVYYCIVYCRNIWFYALTCTNTQTHTHRHIRTFRKKEWEVDQKREIINCTTFVTNNFTQIRANVILIFFWMNMNSVPVNLFVLQWKLFVLMFVFSCLKYRKYYHSSKLSQIFKNAVFFN